MRNFSAAIAVVALVTAGSVARAEAQEEKDAPPAAFAAFEHLVGGWKGQGIPAKNRLKGWQEKHNWAWKFVKGKAVGMALEITGGKGLTRAQLSRDDKTEVYTLDGTDAEGKPAKFSGKLDDSGLLSLDRLDPPAGSGKERLDLTLNDNKIRYVMRLYRQEPDAPQYALVTESNLGKEGESFAAGGAAADLPKCIVTGGAGGMSVSYQGKSYPICCSGCRDEFTDNPEKYVKKYLLRMEKGEAAPLKTTALTPSDEPEAKAETSKVATKGAMAKGGKSSTKPEAKPANDKADPNAKAATLLSQAQALEKAGKNSAALTYYKRIAKEFADSPSAKTAKAKIKELDGK